MSTEGDVVEVVAAQIAPSTQMTVEEALQSVIRDSLIQGALSRGLRESVKALDRREATLCVLAEDVKEKAYTALVEALCAEHEIQLVKVAEEKVLGEWAGLCKIDKSGTAQNVVACGCVVVRSRMETPAMGVLAEHFKSR